MTNPAEESTKMLPPEPTASATAKVQPSPSPAPGGHSAQASQTLQNPRNQQERLTPAEMFGERFDGGVLEMTFRLNTDRMKQFYRRDFVHLSRLFYAVDQYRAIWQLDQSRLDMVEASIAKKVDAIRGLMDRTIQQADALLATNSHTDKAIYFAQPIEYVAPIISPFAREFMELLVRADDALAKVRTCHLLGLVTSRQKVDIESTCRKAVRSLAPMVRHRRIDLAKYARAVRDEADPDARKLIDAAVGNEIASLYRQGNEEPDAKGTVSVERDLERVAEAVSGNEPPADARPPVAAEGAEIEAAPTAVAAIEAG